MTLQPSLAGLLDNDLPSDRMRILQALTRFREEWQAVAGGQSLLAIEAPVGLLLSDIANCLNLTAQERHMILGSRLIKEVKALTDEQISL